MAGLILGRLPLLLPSPTVPADAMPGFGGSAADVQWENLAAGIRYGQDVASVTQEGGQGVLRGSEVQGITYLPA